MSRRPPARARAAAVAGLVAATLTACGTARPADPTAHPAVPSPPVTGTPTTTAHASPPGASPYVEPGVVDGAPHHGGNNAYRRSAGMSAEGARNAQREADRIRPVLERLREQKTWDAASVRAALRTLGYDEQRLTEAVQHMPARYETDHYVTPEGTRIGLFVEPGACVTGFVQPSNVEVRTNGVYMEGGCFEPPYGH
ncbi:MULTISPECIES: hypothetical protein [unclassified Streptomyces]|uniref:hypothetical protein n=1 Tax=unclassified Streptomyces TaxID=2593676 RepID=UPI0008DD5B93|nr:MULTISPECIES: hypothetical protein [unclassified Streptomyces]OII68207.1 hypothetical protein BJP39_22020 [Streptomyces sp. CC77]